MSRCKHLFSMQQQKKTGEYLSKKLNIFEKYYFDSKSVAIMHDHIPIVDKIFLMTTQTKYFLIEKVQQVGLPNCKRIFLIEKVEQIRSPTSILLFTTSSLLSGMIPDVTMRLLKTRQYIPCAILDGASGGQASRVGKIEAAV